jgi:hypothetical protein
MNFDVDGRNLLFIARLPDKLKSTARIHYLLCCA